MSRTTEARVKKIIKVDPSIQDLEPFMEAASILVQAQCESLDEDTAATVETWLTAHMITIRDMRIDTEKVDVLSRKYQSKVDLGLACSMYGQTAMNLDSSGGLARWHRNVINGPSVSKNVGVIYLGMEK